MTQADEQNDGKSDVLRKAAQPLAFQVDDSDEKTVKVVINNPVLLLYKLYVETAERNIDRRQNANRFYLTATGAVFPAITFVLGSNIGAAGKEALTLLLLGAGVIIQAFWLLTVYAARNLSASKYDVILKMEREHLPIEPFAEEWRVHSAKSRGAVKFTDVEAFVPAALGVALTAAIVLTLAGVITLPLG